MTNILMVPVHLDALLLEEDQAIAEAMANFSRLPYSNYVQDINDNTANISENIISNPFEDQNLFLKAGIHLHWALPDALTTGKQTPQGTSFPIVPNRWLITRSQASKPAVVEKTWIVESDYLYPDGTGDLTGSITIPFTPDPTRGKYRPFRYQGRCIPLDSWQAQDPQAEYVDRLTAVGYGEPTFAAFYPNCHSVFGFYDSEITSPTDGLYYDLIGWYSNATQDFLTTFIQDLTATQKRLNQPAPTTQQVQDAVKNTLHWTTTLSTGLDFPQQMLCYARLTFKLPNGIAPPAKSDTQVTLAIGNTGTEALSAYLAHNVNSEQKAMIEDELEALQLSARLENRQLDIGAKFSEARHEKGFAAQQGGYLWTIKSATDTSSSADALQAQKQSNITLPDDLARQLNALNLAQQSYDQAAQNILSSRKQLFADWCKYMLSAYPPDDARENYPDIDEARYFIESISLASLQQAINATGQINYDANGLPVLATTSPTPSLATNLLQALNDLQNSLATFNQSPTVQQAKTSYTLKPISGPRYWQPAEPVVLMVGAAIQPNERHGRDTVLSTRQIIAGSTVQDLLPKQLAAVRSKIDGIARDETSPSPTGFNTWTQRPWNPFLLEWQVEVFPVNRQGNLHPDTEAYQPDFITSNYTLAENQPDLALSYTPDENTFIKAATIYSGRSLLTSYAQNHLKELLDGYLNDSQNDTTSDTYHYLKSAYDIVNAPDFYSLSQSLGGFNNALLMHRQTMQLNISEPLGFDDYQQFTQNVANAVQRENKSAPQPQWDFNPIRSGTMNMLRLRLVDTFGQIRDLQWSDAITTEQMRGPQSSDQIALPPRLMQPARLNFRWLAANSDEQEMNDHPATSPVCGWVVPNNLDGSLLIYDSQGKILGLLDQQAQWKGIPGTTSTAVDDIVNAHLRQMVQYLIKQGASFLASFISAVDTGLTNIDPENFAQHQDLALLMGRPMALVRASLNLALQGLPAIHEGWNNFRQDLRRTGRDTNDFPGVVFPIRIGEYQQLNDGLVGYWKEREDVYEDDLFYAPQSDPIADVRIKTHADHPAPLQQTVLDPPTIVSMLIDPRGSVHATTGILPVKELTIPPDQYVPALQAIEVFFLATPIVTDVGAINVPLPAEAGYQWSWASTGGAGAIGKVKVEVTFSAAQEIREGWLKLGPAPTNQPATS